MRVEHSLTALVKLSAAMVFCALVGCSKRSFRDKNVRFCPLPTVISHQAYGRRAQSKAERSLDSLHPSFGPSTGEILQYAHLQLTLYVSSK